MSLYKGNNLISGHQVLYSTIGNNTDGAMTQDAVTDELSTKVNAADIWYDSTNSTLYIGVAQS